jgi:o-succinylbenzoate synthase
VKISRVRITPFSLPLQQPFTTAHGVLTSRTGFAVHIEAGNGEAGNGVTGCGEASPLLAFGTESEACCAQSLGVLAANLPGRDIAEIDALLDSGERLAANSPTARAAIDLALHDLLARLHGVSVAALLVHRYAGTAVSLEQANRSVQSRPLSVNAVIGGADSAAVRVAAGRALAAGYRVLKLKLGVRCLVDELALVATVAEQLEGRALLRLDVNGAWSEAQANSALDRLDDLPVEWLEQPVPACALDAMARLRARGGCALAVDEAVPNAPALERVIAHGAADWVVIKPAAVGGLRAAWRMAQTAQAAGLGIAVTSFIDSSIGVHGAWQLAAALPGTLPACGLSTGALLLRDLAAPLPLVGARLEALPRFGIGPVFDARSLAQARCGSQRAFC